MNTQLKTDGKEKRDMTAVIEQRLRKYEKHNRIYDDMSLLVALREILSEEEQREECDWDVVAEATEAILTLEGENSESFEATEADAAAFRSKAPDDAGRVNDDPGATDAIASSAAHAEGAPAIVPPSGDLRKKALFSRPSKRIRWIVPIAATIAALLVGAAIAGVFFLDLFNMDADTYKDLPEGTALTDGVYELEKSASRKTEEDLGSLGTDEYATLLVPADLPEGWSVQSVVTDKLSNASLVEIILDAKEGRTVRVKALLGLNEGLPAATERIGGFDVAVTEYDSLTQGEFVFGADYYLIQAPNRDLLVAAVESLEVAK